MIIIVDNHKLETEIHNSQPKNKEHELKLKTHKSKIKIEETVNPKNIRRWSLN